MIPKERDYEAHQDIEYEKFTEYGKKRRMRRMPDILSVGVQDFLYSWKSELRKYKVIPPGVVMISGESMSDCLE